MLQIRFLIRFSKELRTLGPPCQITLHGDKVFSWPDTRVVGCARVVERRVRWIPENREVHIQALESKEPEQDIDLGACYGIL